MSSGSTPRAFRFVLLGLTLLAGFRPARAQDQPPSAAVTRTSALTAADRDAAFANLAVQAALIDERNVFKQVFRLAAPSVVHVEADKQESDGGFGRTRAVEEAGSGVIIEVRGAFYVITNRHVIKDAKLTNIRLNLADQREFRPTRIWSDPATDVAVLGLPASDVVPARIGDSDRVEIGDVVMAVGSPFGLSHSATVGIVSAKGRRDLDLGDQSVKFQDFIQTDAAINPGNSGGPLVNLRGEVIGINTAIASNSGGSEGIGFAIPMRMVMIIARQLIERGAVVRAALGVNLDSGFTMAVATRLGLPVRRGARITAVAPESAAAKAALQKDDVILEYDGIVVDNDSHLINLVSLTELDREVPVLVFRDRRTMTLQVRVGRREDRGEITPP